MTIVNKLAFIELLKTETKSIESIENDVGVFKWFRTMLKDATCNVCGELVLDKKEFLWWRGDKNIIICVDCAEHTLAGLNRDLDEITGLNKENEISVLEEQLAEAYERIEELEEKESGISKENCEFCAKETYEQQQNYQRSIEQLSEEIRILKKDSGNTICITCPYHIKQLSDRRVAKIQELQQQLNEEKIKHIDSISELGEVALKFREERDAKASLLKQEGKIVQQRVIEGNARETMGHARR